jgi:hypothetical protein
MDNLIPTVITDVNGKITTVHKRSAAGFPTVKKGIPAPGMPLEPKYVARQAMKDFEAVGINLVETPDGNKNLFHLAKRYPKELSKLVKRVQRAGDRERAVWEHLIGQTDLHNGKRSVLDMTPRHYRMWSTLLPMAIDLFTDLEGAMSSSNNPMQYYTQNIRGLAEAIESTERRQGRFADDDGFRRVAATMIVIKVNKAGTGSGQTNKETLDTDIDFITENLKAVTPIIPQLMQRGNAERSFIEQVLASNASSLNNGIL